MATPQVMSIANWNDNFYDGYAISQVGSWLYFWALVIFGNWMLFNLFVAILIQKFLEKKEQSDTENLERMQVPCVCAGGRGRVRVCVCACVCYKGEPGADAGAVCLAE